MQPSKNKMTADDTFRTLKRLPIRDVFEAISSTTWGLDISEDRFEEIIESYGYTLEEFNQFASQYVRRK